MLGFIGTRGNGNGGGDGSCDTCTNAMTAVDGQGKHVDLPRQFGKLDTGVTEASSPDVASGFGVTMDMTMAEYNRQRPYFRNERSSKMDSLECASNVTDTDGATDDGAPQGRRQGWRAEMDWMDVDDILAEVYMPESMGFSEQFVERLVLGQDGG